MVKRVTDVVKDDGLNVLFNSAGIATKSTRLPFVKAEDIESSFKTNTVAPVMLTKVQKPNFTNAFHSITLNAFFI